jgi:capsid assembly protease
VESVSLHRVARFAGRPLLMSPEAAQLLAQRALALDPRALGRTRSSLIEKPKAFLARLGLGFSLAEPMAFEDDEAGEIAPRKPFGYAPAYAGAVEHEGHGWNLVDGIACLNVEGALMDRGFYACGEMFWGYDTMALALREAMSDTRVKGVFVRMDSPGGVVAGGLEALTADLRALRQAGNASGKPVFVFADCAASAAYWISAQADRIFAPAVGLVGSIGAVIVHEDYSGALEKAGVVVTPVQFGARKTDGAGFKPLSEEALRDLQADIDAIGERFVADVTRGREILSRNALIATQAAVFQAEHPDRARSGLALGFIDEVASEEAAFAALKAHVSGALSTSSAPQRAPARGNAAKSGAQTETTTMRTQARARIEALLARKAMDDTEKLDAIRKILDEEEQADAEGEEDETTAEGEDEEPTAEGETDETEAEGEDEEPAAEGEDDETKAHMIDARVAGAILKLPEARGREQLAAQLALTPNMSVTSAKALLATSPKASRLVGAVPDPKLGGGNGDLAKPASEDQKAAAFVRQCHGLATGKAKV